MPSKAFKTEAEWVTFRKQRITASEMAAAVGASQFRTPEQLYIDKTTALHDQDESEHYRWGKLLEPVVAREYCERRAETSLIALPGYTVYWPESHDWISATPDYFQERPDKQGVGVLEIKTAGAHNSREWRDEPPVEYIVQLQVTMACSGLKWGTIACLVAGQKLVWRDYDYDADFVASLLKNAANVHRAIQARDFDAMLAGGKTVLSSEAWAKAFPQDSGGFIEFTELDKDAQTALTAAHDILVTAKEKSKQFDALAEAQEHVIKGIMRDASSLKMPDGSRYDWRVQHRKEFTVSASSSRVFRFHKPKKTQGE